MLVSGSFNLAGSVSNFLLVALGGVVLGVVGGLLVSQLIRRLEDYLVEVTLTTIVVFGTFIAAEEIGVSGVIAVVVAGIIVGNYGERTAMSPTTRIRLTQFWEYVAFIANSFVFLIIGLAIDLNLLLNNIVPIFWAIIAVLVARAVVIYALGAPIDRFSRTLPIQSRHVLFWGGLRGAIALALALSLPAEAGDWHSALLAMTFGVVLFTLLVQGTTIEWLLKRLGLIKAAHIEYEIARGRIYANQAVARWLEQLRRDGMLSQPLLQQLRDEVSGREGALVEEMSAMFQEQEGLRQEELQRARFNALDVQRAAMQELLRQGRVSERAYRMLLEEMNQQQQELEDQ